uniref:GCR131 n=1 Tax=Schmidtea mediterranea TaxID=79327 RepID=A0A193KUM5_SCHMD|nr:GCR131 [Schmidtea mediterranea]
MFFLSIGGIVSMFFVIILCNKVKFIYFIIGSLFCSAGICLFGVLATSILFIEQENFAIQLGIFALIVELSRFACISFIRFIVKYLLDDYVISNKRGDIRTDVHYFDKGMMKKAPIINIKEVAFSTGMGFAISVSFFLILDFMFILDSISQNNFVLFKGLHYTMMSWLHILWMIISFIGYDEQKYYYHMIIAVIHAIQLQIAQSNVVEGFLHQITLVIGDLIVLLISIIWTLYLLDMVLFNYFASWRLKKHISSNIIYSDKSFTSL